MNGELCLMGIAFQFCKMKRVLAMDGGDGLHNNMNVINATGLYTYSKCCHMYFTTIFFLIEERQKKEPELSGLKNSQPFQMAKDAKIKKFTIRKVHSKEKAKDVTMQLFAKNLRNIKRSEYSVTQRALSKSKRYAYQILSIQPEGI